MLKKRLEETEKAMERIVAQVDISPNLGRQSNFIQKIFEEKLVLSTLS